MRFVLAVTLVLFACEALAKRDLSPGKWPEGVLQAYHDQILGEPGLEEKLRATSVGFSTSGQQGCCGNDIRPAGSSGRYSGIILFPTVPQMQFLRLHRSPQLLP